VRQKPFGIDLDKSSVPYATKPIAGFGEYWYKSASPLWDLQGC
jgi:hypothetical protein